MLKYTSNREPPPRETGVSRTNRQSILHSPAMGKQDQNTSVEAWERKAISMLPGLLKEIAQTTDYSTAMAIAREKGGRRASIGIHPEPRGWLSRLVGIEKAQVIATALNPDFSGMDYLIPGLENVSCFPKVLIELAQRG